MIARHLGRPARYALPVLACALLALPASALASGGSGGGGGLGGAGGSSGTGATGSGTTTLQPTADPSAPVSAAGDGVTLQTSSATVLHGRLVLTGTATGAAGRTLQIERRGTTPGATWTPATTTTVSTTGSFRAVWRTDQSGRVTLRALVGPSGAQATGALAASAPPTLTVTVYPTSRATIYGPGFYGRRTACGGRLTRATVGVANRRLPCGTMVSVLYDGRTLTVPVIDRGPYANGADWDLTMATARALGIEGTEQIGTIALSSTTVSPARRR